jgi:protocatechuate 3,4-dioxygenase beta subunit
VGLLAWATLTAIGLLRLLLSFVLGWKLKAESPVLREVPLLDAAAAAARSLGLSVTPEVRVSRAIPCPVVWCWGRRPVLILPDTMTGSAREWSAILCHELAHWKRADHLSALVTEFLTCLVPWQPLAWVLRTRMADLSEIACDDWALTHARTVSAPDYAEALLGLAVARRRPLIPAAVSRRSGLAVRVRHILEEAQPMPRTGSLWSTVVACLALGLVAALALAQTRQARAVAAEPLALDSTDENAGEKKRAVLEGTVRGRNGEPQPDAEVLWVGADEPRISHVAIPHDHPDFGKHRMKILTRGRTDNRGRFTLEAPVKKPSGNGPWTTVVARKPGLAPASSPVALDGKPIEILLEPAVPIVGRLLTPGGEPASGVVVRLEDYTDGNWRDIRTVRIMQYFGTNLKWDSPPTFYPGEFRTDDTGRFVIDGFVPAGVFARIVLTPVGQAVEELTVSTGESTEPTPELAAFSIRPLAREFTHTLAPARPVVGRVIDAETKAPLAGVTVKVTPMRRHGGMPIRAVTDAEGRYRVSDREGESYWVTAYPAPGSGHLPAERGSIKWPAGESELRVDLALRRGVPIRGQVIDEDTGAPVPNVGVVYQPKHGNGQVRGDDDFRNPALTDAEGRFVLSGVRGPGIVAAEASSDGYIRRKVAPVDFGHTSSLHVHGLARFEIPAEGDAPVLVIKLKKGITLEARAVQPDGSPLDAVRAWCPELTSRLLNNWVSPGEFTDGVFRLPGAEPGRVYRVFFLTPDTKFAAVAELKAGANRQRPLEIKLEPTASIRGRILDADGMPLQGAQILPNIQLVDKGSELNERERFDEFTTQLYFQFTNEPLKPSYPAEFHHQGLIPGVRYFVTWYSREKGHSWRAVEALKPGENRDLGDIRSESKKGGKDGD